MPTPTTAAALASPSTTGGVQSGVVESSPLPALPLEEAVPGFTDAITALTWDNHGVDILQWRAEQGAPEAVGAFAHGGGSSNRSLDASGGWFSEVRGSSVLVVRPVGNGDSGPVGTRLLEETGVRLWSAVWHDSQPGRLAWLACEVDAPGSSVGLFFADVTAEAAPVEMLQLGDVRCADRGVWLARWGDWGLLLHRTGGSGTTQVLLSADGRRVTEGRLDPRGEWFVGVGPELTTVWTEGLANAPASSFALSPDGLDRTPVPGLAPGERLESALISPNGSHLALVLDLAANFGSALRIVEVDAGPAVVEITHPSFWVSGMVWSTDGRYLVYQRWPDIASNRAGVPSDVELVFYDTETRGGVALPLPGYASLLRSVD